MLPRRLLLLAAMAAATAGATRWHAQAGRLRSAAAAMQQEEHVYATLAAAAEEAVDEQVRSLSHIAAMKTRDDSAELSRTAAEVKEEELVELNKVLKGWVKELDRKEAETTASVREEVTKDQDLMKRNMEEAAAHAQKDVKLLVEEEVSSLVRNATELEDDAREMARTSSAQADLGVKAAEKAIELVKELPTEKAEETVRMSNTTLQLAQAIRDESASIDSMAQAATAASVDTNRLIAEATARAANASRMATAAVELAEQNAFKMETIKKMADSAHERALDGIRALNGSAALDLEP